MFCKVSVFYVSLFMYMIKCAEIRTECANDVNTSQYTITHNMSILNQETILSQAELFVNTDVLIKQDATKIAYSNSEAIYPCPKHFDNALESVDCEICEFLTDNMDINGITSSSVQNEKKCERFLGGIQSEFEDLGLNIYAQSKVCEKPENHSQISLHKGNLHNKNQVDTFFDTEAHKKEQIYNPVYTISINIENEIFLKLSRSLGVLKTKKLMLITVTNCRSIPKKLYKANQKLYLSLIKIVNSSDTFDPDIPIKHSGKSINLEHVNYECNSKSLNIPLRSLFTRSQRYDLILFPQCYASAQNFDLSYSKQPLIEYEKIINRLFFENDKEKKNLNSRLWDLLLYIPEIIFYLEWRINQNKIIPHVSTDYKEFLEKELFLIYEILSNYTKFEVTHTYMLRYPLNKSIINLRKHIRDYLQMYYKDSIQYYMFNIALNQENHKQTNTHFCTILYILTFTIDTVQHPKKIYNGIIQYLKTHPENYFSNFKQLLFRCVERNSYVFSTLENAVVQLKSKRNEQMCDLSTITLAHPFYKHFFMINIDAESGALLKIKYAKITNAVYYYYDKIIRTIIDG